MSRLPELKPEAMTPAQRAIYDQRKGKVGGPSGVWLRHPDLAGPADALITMLRNGKLDPNLFELMTLIVARTWTVQYVFNAHKQLALDAGVAADVIEAIRTRRVPGFANENEKIVYEVTTELLNTRDLLATSHDRAVKALGLEKTIELITGIGLYSTIAGLLRSFDISVPDAERQLA
jgi:4-carboxymuconolactone decarboxylase